MPKVTAIKIQKNQKRVNVYLDNKFAFGIDLENLLKHQLKVDKELSQKEIKEIIIKAEFSKTYNNILRFTTLRPRSQKEVINWFKRKKVHPSLQSKLIKKLGKLELLDDKKFAHWWVEQRTTFKLQSKKELRYELLKKGVASGLIDQSINSQNINEVKIAKKLIKKRRLEGSKAAQYLIRKGFPWEIVKRVVKNIGE